MITLTAASLRRVLEINSFRLEVGDGELVFFALRGGRPISRVGAFQPEHLVEVRPVDHVHMRCTLGQWRPDDGQIAVFPGSTVPHVRHVRTAAAAGGKGTNKLMPGLYADYKKGIHRPGKPTAHEAFRQTQGRPVQRSADDVIYEDTDEIEIETPYDNLHASWTTDVDGDYFASAGCQVVLGKPKCVKRENRPDTGPWAIFKANAYAIPQKQFHYMLLPAQNVERWLLKPVGSVPALLRFGSRGPLVGELQLALQRAGFYEGAVDENFFERTCRSLLAFQEAKFSPEERDAVAGPRVAAKLGLAWPTI